MAPTRKKTDDVLASARKDLQAQLAVVRDEMTRLAAEERALTQALSTLDGDGASPPTASAPRASGRASSGKTRARSSARAHASGKGTTTRRRRRRGVSKSTADRVSELQGLLSSGPKTRNDLAAALKVSPARVQQLFAELGSSVSSQPDPAQPRGKLWALTRGGDGASAAKRTGETQRRNG